MRGFYGKVLSLFILISILTGYNVVLIDREKEEEIAYLNAKLSAYKAYVQSSQETATESPYQDGEWEGEAEGFGGIIRVQVTVQEGSIQEVKILSAEQEDAVYLAMAETVLSSIQKEQSTQVDTVSGATFSSAGIIQASEQALEKAAK